MNIIHLDQPTAATMTSMKEMLKVYEKVNKGDKYSEAIGKYRAIYSNLMDEVLGRVAA